MASSPPLPHDRGQVGAAPAQRGASLPERGAILRAALGIALYAGAFGATFGAVAVSAGLSTVQAMALSLVMFTGASQFAFVGVIGAGGSPLTAIPAALLLGLRNAFYGVSVTSFLRPRGLGRLVAAQLVIDETTAMAGAQPSRTGRRYAFWVTGGLLFTCWNVGTYGGAVLGTGLDAAALGLDAAAPAVFLALLWPQLRRPGAPALAVGGAVLAVVLIPLVPSGVPVIAAAVVAVLAGLIAPVGPLAGGRGTAEDQPA